MRSVETADAAEVAAAIRLRRAQPSVRAKVLGRSTKLMRLRADRERISLVPPAEGIAPFPHRSLFLRALRGGGSRCGR